MDRLIVWSNRLQHNFERLIRPKLNHVRNNTRTFAKFSSSTYVIDNESLSKVPSLRNVDIDANTFPRSSSIDIARFSVSQRCNDRTLFCYRTSVLVASGHRARCYTTEVRCFSDASSVARSGPTSVQLEGFWKDLSESAPVEFCQNSIVWLQATTGLPWWATIVLATWSARLIFTLPLALYQNYILAKVKELEFEMNAIVKELKLETNYAVYKFKWTEDYARKVYNKSLKKQWQLLIERENCHPMKTAVLLVVQVPLWIVMSTSLRNLCYALPYSTQRAHEIYLDLTVGGFGWITNLAATDNYLVLPIVIGLLNLTIIEMQNLTRSTEPSKRQKFATNLFRLVSIGMIPLASFVPAGISLYWASSSAFGIVQNLVVMSPRVRRFVRIPPTDNELDEPYRHLYEQLRRRVGFKDIAPLKTVKKL